MALRTDIALEQHDFLEKKSREGVEVEHNKRGELEIVRVHIKNQTGAENMKKPIGEYYTIHLPEFSHETELLDERFEIVTEIIKRLLPSDAETFLVAGLGNENITPDALGPICAKKIFSTRHFESVTEMKSHLPSLSPVASISTGVLGQTGIETAEYISGIVGFVKPDAVIIVDALACSSIMNLGKTIQLSDTGITPGSGVGNFRKTIDKQTLGVPVVSMGVPTVMELSADENMIVTPKDIDTIISRAAGLLSLSINCAVQPKLPPELFLSLS